MGLWDAADICHLASDVCLLLRQYLHARACCVRKSVDRNQKPENFWLLVFWLLVSEQGLSLRATGLSDQALR